LPADKPQLEVFTGREEKSPERSDGVVFQVLVGESGGEYGQNFESVLEHEQVAHEWERHRLDLSEWAGESVVIRFVADCGPDGNTVTDHARWGGA